jgi:hypothetical protein
VSTEAEEEVLSLRLQDPKTSFIRKDAAAPCPLIVAFGGIKLGLGMPVFEFFQFLRGIPARQLFIRDVRQAWYHRGLPDVAPRISGITQFLKKEISETGAQRVVMFGNSMGGYAALLFGALVSAHVVHAFAPQTFLAPSRLIRVGDWRWKRDIWRVYLSKDRREHLDLRDAISLAKQTQFHIHFSPANHLDAVHARHLAGLSNVHLHEHPAGGHRVVKTLRDSGALQQIVRSAMAGSAEPSMN